MGEPSNTLSRTWEINRPASLGGASVNEVRPAVTEPVVQKAEASEPETSKKEENEKLRTDFSRKPTLEAYKGFANLSKKELELLFPEGLNYDYKTPEEFMCLLRDHKS